MGQQEQKASGSGELKKHEIPLRGFLSLPGGDYYRAMRDDGVMGWFNPTSKHFFVPIDVEAEEISSKPK